jgi:hypothetical protein
VVVVVALLIIMMESLPMSQTVEEVEVGASMALVEQVVL